LFLFLWIKREKNVKSLKKLRIYEASENIPVFLSFGKTRVFLGAKEETSYNFEEKKKPFYSLFLNDKKMWFYFLHCLRIWL